MPDNSGAVDLGAARPEPEPEAQQQTQRVLTAFIVLVDEKGNPQPMAFDDPNIETILPELTNDLIYAACATIVKDIQAAETAEASAHATGQFMMQQAQAMAERQQAAAVRANLGNLHA